MFAFKGFVPLFALILHASLVLLATFPSSSRADTTPTYTILAPSKLRPNSDYHVSASLHDTTEHVDVDVSVSGQEHASGKFNSVSKTVVINPGETRIIKFDIGEWGPGNYKLNAVGKGGLSFRNETTIQFEQKSYSVFIQSDKAIYKPGQLVQFRAIVVDPSLQPSVTGAIDIYVTDAKGNRIKQWNRELTSRGIIAKDLQLSSQPVLGDWTIVVQVLDQKFTKVFTVAEYILPTFDVDVILPSYATYNSSDKVVATIKATYTYGKPVKGEVTLTVQPRVRYNRLTVRPLEQFQTKVHLDGSVDIPVDVVKDLSLKTDFFDREIEFFALVEETHTGRKYNKTGILKLFDKDIKVELIKTSKTFKPGLKYGILLKVAYQDDIPVEDNGPPLLLRYGYGYNEESWTNKLEAVPKKGMMLLDVIPPKKDVNVMGMRAEYRGQTYYINNIEAAHSPSDNFLQVTLPGNQVPQVGDSVSLEVVATEPFKKVVFEVMGRGDIVLARSIVVDDATTHQFTFTVTHRMAPKARVLAYYVRSENQEVVADALNFDVEGVFRTPCSVSTSINETKPGANVDVTVSTKPGAFVGVLGLDQSILLLKTGNDVTQKDVIDDLETYDGGKNQNDFGNHWFRKKRSLWWPGSISAAEIFQDSGVVLLSNGLVAQTFQFIYYRNSPVAFAEAVPDAAGGPSIANNDKPSRVKVRKYFPETWLWDSQTAEGDGRAVFRNKAPDTITSWVISAFSMDSVTGLGIAPNTAKVTVFRPFFIQLALPYSIVRGETVAIQVVVFNYMNKPQQAEVSLENKNDEFDFTIASNDVNSVESVKTGQKRKFVTVPAQDGATVSFLITPKKLGYIDIKVSAISNSAGDSVLRKLLVKAEGQPQFFNKAVLVDLRTSASSKVNQNVSVAIPRNAIPGSERVTISVIGDVLGPSMSNLDDLLQMPYGCGEQNMLQFVPNIVILEYLTRANRLTGSIKGKALNHMESGYQRELTYKRDDGSFSAFGNSDKSGSTWLTSFVLKSFQQAKPHMNIDQDVIDNCIRWLMARQLSDGSFDEPGEIHHKAMQGGSGTSSAALSAFVIAAIFQDKNTATRNYTSQVQKADNYLVKQMRASQSSYEMAIITYALHVSGSPAKDSAYDKMMNFAKRSGDHTWWAQQETKKEDLSDKQSFHFFLPKSTDIESTAYALLTMVLRGDAENAIPVMRWLVSQQNEKGGFSSTQDTVVGIQALAQLATRVLSSTIQITAKFRVGADGETPKNSEIRVSASNANVLQRQELPSNTRYVEMEASGFGTSIVQISWQYNLAVSAEEPAFFLTPQLGKTSTENFMQLNVCTYYKAGNSTNMAVMEVALPSGYTADVDALPSISRAKEVKRIDTSDGDTNVIIYFDRITRDEICLTVPAHRNYKVANHKPVPVTLYDYYNRAQTARIFYEPMQAKMCDACEGEDCGAGCNLVLSETDKDKLRNPITTGAASGVFLSSVVISVAVLCNLVKFTLRNHVH